MTSVHPFALFPLAVLCAAARAFNISRTDNIMAQWGAISFENSLATYCDGTVDLLTLGWLHYSPTALPSFASPTIPGASCTSAVFPNSQLPDCPSLAADITACQSKGVAVLLALDPGSGLDTDWYTSEASARAYADQLWDLFFGGTSNTRPFGNAVLDGILVQAPDAHITTRNIEGFPVFFDQMRLHAPIAGDGSKPYILAARMICPVLDENALSAALNTTSLDVVQISVAGHDSLCSVAHYDDKTMWNFDRWDRWATTFSPYKGVKLYLDVPSYSDGYNSYVNATRVAQIANDTHMLYPDTFGGVSYWDCAHAVQNDGFNVALRDAFRLPDQPPSSSSTGSPSIAPPDSTTGLPTEITSPAKKAISPILILSIAIPLTAVAAFILLAIFWLRSRNTRRGSQIRPYGRRRLKHLGVERTDQIPVKSSSGEGVSSPAHQALLYFPSESQVTESKGFLSSRLEMCRNELPVSRPLSLYDSTVTLVATAPETSTLPPRDAKGSVIVP